MIASGGAENTANVYASLARRASRPDSTCSSPRRSGGGQCSGTVNAIVPNAFKPGTASLALSAKDCGSNFNQTAAAALVQLKLVTGP